MISPLFFPFQSFDAADKPYDEELNVAKDAISNLRTSFK